MAKGARANASGLLEMIINFWHGPSADVSHRIE